MKAVVFGLLLVDCFAYLVSPLDTPRTRLIPLSQECSSQKPGSDSAAVEQVKEILAGASNAEGNANDHIASSRMLIYCIVDPKLNKASLGSSSSEATEFSPSSEHIESPRCSCYLFLLEGLLSLKNLQPEIVPGNRSDVMSNSVPHQSWLTAAALNNAKLLICLLMLMYLKILISVIENIQERRSCNSSVSDDINVSQAYTSSDMASQSSASETENSEQKYTLEKAYYRDYSTCDSSHSTGYANSSVSDDINVSQAYTSSDIPTWSSQSSASETENSEQKYTLDQAYYRDYSSSTCDSSHSGYANSSVSDDINVSQAYRTSPDIPTWSSQYSASETENSEQKYSNSSSESGIEISRLEKSLISGSAVIRKGGNYSISAENRITANTLESSVSSYIHDVSDGLGQIYQRANQSPRHFLRGSSPNPYELYDPIFHASPPGKLISDSWLRVQSLPNIYLICGRQVSSSGNY